MGSKRGMDAVRADDDIGFHASAIGKRHPGDVVVLIETGAAMPGMHNALGQGRSQHLDEIGAVHSEGGVPAGGIRDLDWRDRRSVVAEITGVMADKGSGLL